MRKTENLKLNLLERHDGVDPGPLNENAAALDAAVADALAQTGLRGELAELAAAVGSGGQNARIAWGSYVGNGKYGEANAKRLDFDFIPVLVLVGRRLVSTSGTVNIAWPAVFMRDAILVHSDTDTERVSVTWGDTWVSWQNGNGASSMMNTNNMVYLYVALGYSPQ